jgi:hypothetical protein
MSRLSRHSQEMFILRCGNVERITLARPPKLRLEDSHQYA